MEEWTTASPVVSQETIMVGSIGSYFDFGSVSEGTREPWGAGEEICSVGVPSVREGEFVDIEVDSGAEVSCLPAIIGADTYTLHEMRLSMVGGHHVAAGGGKLHELGARILGLEAGDVRGDVVNLLVRFRVWTLVRHFCRHKIYAVVAGRRSSPLTVEMLTLSGKLRTLASPS